MSTSCLPPSSIGLMAGKLGYSTFTASSTLLSGKAQLLGPFKDEFSLLFHCPTHHGPYERYQSEYPPCRMSGSCVIHPDVSHLNKLSLSVLIGHSRSAETMLLMVDSSSARTIHLLDRSLQSFRPASFRNVATLLLFNPLSISSSGTDNH